MFNDMVADILQAISACPARNLVEAEVVKNPFEDSKGLET